MDLAKNRPSNALYTMQIKRIRSATGKIMGFKSI